MFEVKIGRKTRKFVTMNGALKCLARYPDAEFYCEGSRYRLNELDRLAHLLNLKIHWKKEGNRRIPVKATWRTIKERVPEEILE